MKHKLIWVALVFLLAFILLLVFQVRREPAVTEPIVDLLELNLPQIDDAGYELIGSGIFRNETGGQIDRLTYWGKGEDFPSLCQCNTQPYIGALGSLVLATSAKIQKAAHDRPRILPMHIEKMPCDS